MRSATTHYVLNMSDSSNAILYSEKSLIPRRSLAQRWAKAAAVAVPKAAELSVVASAAEASDGIHGIRFIQSGVSLTTEADESILEAGLREDVDLQFSCTLGGCGTCRVKLVSGQVDMLEDNCLSDEEIAEGYILACSSRPLTELEIDA